MKRLLILGAGFLQSFVIKKAREMGYYTMALDADPHAVGFAEADEYGVVNIVDEEACLRYALAHRIDGVLTAATDYGVLTSAYIAERLGLPGLYYSSARRIKNKALVRKCLYENRVDDAEQAYEVNAQTDLRELAAGLHYPVMVKPCDGSGSRGAGRVDRPDQLPKACQNAMNGSITHRAEVETFIFGREYGAESLVVDGQVHVLAIMKKWMTEPPYYAELGHALPSGLPEDIERKAVACVERAIRALDINFGSVNMDMLITGEGKIYIVDVGARMGGNMIGPCVIPYGTGVDYMAAMLRNAAGDPVDLSVSPHGAVATRLLAFRKGEVKRLPDFQQLGKKYGVEIYHHMKVGDPVNDYHTNLDGCGYIVCRDACVESAAERVQTVLCDLSESIFDRGQL